LAEQNLVVERLKERRNGSTGMLTGWLRDLVSRHAAPGASVVPYVPFRTPFRPLTQKATTSGEQGSNLVHRQMFDGFARSVAQKFEDTKALVPYVSKITDEKTKTWGEVERVFSGAQSGSIRHEEPLQPGEMRSGTVIQKFDMFPKPGQPVESFKAQSTPSISRTRTKETAPPKKGVTPGQRLFSRVTEITPNKPYEPQSEAAADEVDEPEKTSLHPDVQPAYPEPSLADVEPELQTPAKPVQQTQAEDEPENLLEAKPQKPSNSPVDMPLHQTPGREEPVKPEKREVKQEETREKPLIAVPKAQPVAKSVDEKLPKAMPVRKESEQQDKVHRALPVTAKPGKIPLQTRQGPMTSRVVQRSTDLPETSVQNESALPEIGEEQKAASVQQIMPPMPEADALMPRLQFEQPASEQESQSAITGLEMPLRKDVQQRQQTSKGLVHSTKAVQMKPAAQQPLLVQQPQSPLISPQKYKMELNTSNFDVPGEEVSQSGVSALPLSFNLSRNLPAGWQARTTSSHPTMPEQKMLSHLPAPQREAENRLSPSLMQNDLTSIQPSQMQSQLINQESFVMLNPKRQPQISTSSEMQRGVKSAIAQSNNVVQRSGASPEQPEPPASAPPTDLGKLADDVLPYVKRLLEIERERTRGSYR
jgi:hypothetical protein